MVPFLTKKKGFWGQQIKIGTFRDLLEALTQYQETHKPNSQINL